MKVTVEFERMDEIEVLDRIVVAAAERLALSARTEFERVARKTIEGLREDVIDSHIKPLVEKALDDQALGLEALILERARFEMQDRLPARIEILTRQALTRLATEEAAAQRHGRTQVPDPPRRRRWRFGL